MSDVYKIGVRLSMVSNVGQMLGVLSKQFTGLNSSIANTQKGLARMKTAMAGALAVSAGVGVLDGFSKIVDASKEYTHQIALMNAAGFTHKELAGSIASAWQTSSKVITSSAQENLATIRELRSAFGKGEGMEHAYAVLPQVQRVSAMLESLTGKKQEHVGFDMIKAIELGTKGGVSIGAVMQQSEMMSRALMQFGGTLSVSDFHQNLKSSRAMAPYMTDDFKYNYLPTLMQEMKTKQMGGAGGAGTAIASLGQVVVGQMIPKALISNWIEAGLINKGSVVADPHNRTMSKILPGGVAGQNDFGANPYLWAQKYAMPAVNKLMAEKHLDQYGAILALTHNRVSAFALQTLINKSTQFERDRKLITEGPSSLSSYNTLLQKDPQMAQQALGNQWQNILAVLGYSVLPKIIPLVVSFANHLNQFATFLQSHANVAKGIMVGIGVLGVALVATGVAIVALVASPIALWIAGIGVASAAIAGIITWLGGWNTVMIGVKMAIGAVTEAFRFLLNPVGAVIHLISMIPGFGGGSAAKPVTAPPRAQQQPTPIHIWMDHRKVGEGVAHFYNSEGNRPQSGGTHFDPLATMPQAAGAF